MRKLGRYWPWKTVSSHFKYPPKMQRFGGPVLSSALSRNTNFSSSNSMSRIWEGRTWRFDCDLYICILTRFLKIKRIYIANSTTKLYWVFRCSELLCLSLIIYWLFNKKYFLSHQRDLKSHSRQTATSVFTWPSHQSKKKLVNSIVICNLFSHGALRSCFKNSRKRVRAFRIELEFGKIGFWREGKTGAPREKPLGKEENQQQTYPFIYLKHEKGTPFGRSLLIKAITPSPPPGEGRQVISPLFHSCSLFVRSRFTCCIYSKKLVVSCRSV